MLFPGCAFFLATKGIADSLAFISVQGRDIQSRGQLFNLAIRQTQAGLIFMHLVKLNRCYWNDHYIPAMFNAIMIVFSILVNISMRSMNDMSICDDDDDDVNDLTDHYSHPTIKHAIVSDRDNIDNDACDNVMDGSGCNMRGYVINKSKRNKRPSRGEELKEKLIDDEYRVDDDDIRNQKNRCSIDNNHLKSHSNVEDRPIQFGSFGIPCPEEHDLSPGNEKVPKFY